MPDESYQNKELEEKLVAVDDCFEIDALDRCEQLLTALKTSIDGYEEDGNDLVFSYYRMQLHSRKVMLAKRQGQVADEDKQRQLTQKYESQFNSLINLQQEADHPIEPKAPNVVMETMGDCEVEEDPLVEDLNALNSLMSDDLCQFIRNFLASIQRPFSSLQDCLDARGRYTEALSILNEFKLGLIQHQAEAEKNKEKTSGKERELLESNIDQYNRVLKVEHAFRDGLSKRLDSKVVQLMENLLADEAVLRADFFSGVELTKENITRRFRLLSQFHPDRFPKSEKQAVFNQFFQILSQEEHAALHQLEQKVGSPDQEHYIAFHKASAETYLKWVIDWQEVSKGNYNHLRVLKPKEYQNTTLTEQLNYKKQSARLSYEQYRAACKLVDGAALKESNLERLYQLKRQQIELRKSMATVLRAADLNVDSQLYAIGAAHILLQCDDATESEFTEIQRILSKAQRREHVASVKMTHLPGEEVASTDSSEPIQSQMLSCYSAGGPLVQSTGLRLAPFATPTGRHQRRNLINKDMTALALKQLATPKARIVSYTSPKEPIVQARLAAKQHQLAGGGLMATGIGVGGVSALAGAADIILLAAGGGTAVGTVLGPVGAIAGLVVGGLGIFFGVKVYKQETTLLKDPKIREELNELVATAIQSYNRNDYDDFLAILSKLETVCEEYARQNHVKAYKGRGVTYEKGESISTNGDALITNLLRYEFRPDGIAYLLVILGEVLVSGQLSFKKNPAFSVQEQAASLFNTVFGDSRLGAKAKRLDQKVIRGKEWTSSGRVKRLWFEKILRPYRYDGMPNKYIEDAREAPFASRLAEIELVARLNFALVEVIIGYLDNLSLARDELVGMYQIVSQNFQFFTVAEHRLTAVEDFLAALGFDPSLELGVQATVDCSCLSIEYTPNIIKDMKGINKVVCSFITELDPKIDIWNTFNVLSNGQFRLSRSDFLEKLEREQDPIAAILRGWFKETLIDERILQYRFLSLVSRLTNLAFELYEVVQEGQEIRYAKISWFNQPVVVAQPLATISLGVKSSCLTGYLRYDGTIRSDDGIGIIPSLVFVEIENPSLYLLHERLKIAKNNPVLRSTILLQIADHHIALAKATDSVSHVRSLLSYTEAEHYYVAALRRHPSQSACWGVAECKLARRELTALIQFLNKRNQTSPKLSLERCPNFWFYQAKAHRYLQKYDQAIIEINHALILDPDSARIKQEKECIDRSQDFIKQRHQQYSRTTLTYDAASYYHWHGSASGQERHYNILSIDGGGIRGIIPAVVLSEVERRTHQPIGYSFNQLSGTSTGGIIALGLSMPELVESGDSSYRRPKFQAADILSLYTEKSADIFTRASRLESFSFKNPKYSNRERSDLFSQYFGNMRLSQLLTEVVVPACNQTQAFTTTYFTRFEARANPDKDFSVFDVAMATSAAPTYFPGHEIKVGDATETFIDGGVQANNPAGYAYKQALDQGIDPASIYLWSLGTGDCIHNSLTPEANQGKLFWAQNLCHYLGAQQNNVDDELRSIMSQRYHRWQFWMESPINLGDHSDEAKRFLVNAGHELIEELDSDETNSLNRLVEHLTR